MKIAILYNRDLYALKALNLLLPALSEHEITLFYSSRVGRGAEEARALQRLHRAERSVVDALDGSQAGAYLGFAALAGVHGCHDHELNHVNEAEGLALLGALRPDLMLSIRFGRILRAPAIAIPARGVMNLHSGVLPAYRGVMPTFWAMLAGDTTVGTTLHWISDATIDTGPSIEIATRRLEPGCSYVDQVWKLYELGVPTMIDAVSRIERGELTPAPAVPPMAADSGRYFTFPDEAALASFGSRGLRLFDEADLAAIAGSFGLARETAP